MLKILMLTLALALLSVSCGQQEEIEPGSQGVGGLVLPSESADITNKEIAILESVCSGLSQKEIYFRQQYADRKVTFEFSTEAKGCKDTVGVKYATGANIEYVNGQMAFIKMARGARIFSSIILRNSGELKGFCDKSESKAMNNRYIITGQVGQWIYLEENNDKSRVIINIETGYDFDRDGKFSIESQEKLLLFNGSSKDRGIVLERVKTSNTGCDFGQESSMFSKLIKINI